MTHALKLTAGIVALLFWFSSFALWKYFDAHRTTVADPGNGRIFPLNTHGSIVFLTSGEHYLLYGLMAGGVCFFVITAVIHFTAAKTP